MDKIPSDTLKTIVNLRKENGLDPSEDSVQKDLKKAKWALTETPRYRRAGRSPLFISGKFLSSTGRDPITGELDSTANGHPSSSSPKRKSNGAGEIDETDFYRFLHGKGFAVKLTKDLLTGQTEAQLPPALAKLDLKFSNIPSNASSVHVTKTTPQIQVAMSLETFLELTGIKA